MVFDELFYRLHKHIISDYGKIWQPTPNYSPSSNGRTLRSERRNCGSNPCGETMNNDLIIRQYQDKDEVVICHMFEDFFNYLIAIDPMDRIIKQPGCGKYYLNKTLNDIKNKNGIFLIAQIKNTIVGLGVAVIETLSKELIMEVIPHKPGRVTELFISAQFRGKGLGTKLMEHLESYLKIKGCDTIHIEVFSENYQTHKLYKKLNYSDRNIDMIKVF